MNVGIFLFNDVEILDFTGPYEVFASTRKTNKVLNKSNISEIYKKPSPFKIFTVSTKNKNIVTSGGMKVISNYNFLDVPKFEILLIPGGIGTRKLISNKVLSWISNQRNTKLIISICTGSLILGAAGLLKSKRATTHWCALKLLKEISPSTIVENKRYVMDEIFSSSGVASGIDLSLKVVENLFGKRIARNTAKYMEYNLIEN